MQALAERIESQSHQLWIGEWRIDDTLNQISRRAEVVHLEPKGMAVLLYLARRPGEVLGREELLSAAWPGVIVGDNALTQVIIKLRKALGDTAREPVYIQAISKKGYRLIAQVHRSEREPPDRPSTPSVQAANASRRAVRWASATLAVAMLIVALAWLMQSERERMASPRGANPAAKASPTAAQPTVIVKPFEAVGAGVQQQLIARAIAADLVTDLSKVAGLWVVSGIETQEALQAGSSAPPRYTLSGTVQQDGERLRLNVLLADAAAGRQLWSERFDRNVKDVFGVQDDLVRSILAVLPVKVSEAETLRLAQRYTRNLDAYEHFLRGQAALLVRRRAQNELARESYWKAIQSDPAFSRAYAGVAMTYALEYQQGWATDGPRSLKRALELAETAVQMSPEMPEAYWVVGFVHTQRRQHDDALRSLDNALRLNPSYADAHALKGGIYTYIGEPAEGVPLLRSALRLNPGSGSLYFLLLGRAYYFSGDTEQAKVNLNQALLRNSENVEARIYLAAAHWSAGERDEARWQANEIRALEPGFDIQVWLATYPMTNAGQKQRLVESLKEIGL